MADIRNLKNPIDKKRKENAFFRTLRLQAKIAEQYNDAVAEKGDAQKLGVTPVAPPPRKLEDEQRDVGFQRQTAFENLKSVTRPDIAQQIVNNLATANDVSDLVLINSNWTDIKAKLNRRDFTREFFTAFLQRYKDILATTVETVDGTDVETGLIMPQTPIDVEDIGAEVRLALPKVEKAEDLPQAGDVLDRPRGFSRKKAQKPKWFVQGYDPTGDFGAGDVARKTALFNELKTYQQNAIDALVKLNIPTDYIDPNDGSQQNALRNITGIDSIEEFSKLKPDIYQQALARIVSVLVDNNIWFNTNKQGFGIHVDTKQPKLHRKGHSTIMLPREGNRRIVGRGVVATPKPRYAEFGRYVIHLPSLNKGILNLRYQSMSNIVNIPQQSISSDLVDFIHDMLESGTTNKSLYNKLKKEDQRFFTKIAGMSEIDDGMGYKNSFHEEEREELDRFNLVKGIVLAGNNAPEVIRELKQFIIKFLHDGRISKNEGLTLLQELVVLT